MHSVYCYSASIHQGRMSDDEINNDRLSPPIIIVGTHKNSFSTAAKRIAVSFYIFENFYNLKHLIPNLD